MGGCRIPYGHASSTYPLATPPCTAGYQTWSRLCQVTTTKLLVLLPTVPHRRSMFQEAPSHAYTVKVGPGETTARPSGSGTMWPWCTTQSFLAQGLLGPGQGRLHRTLIAGHADSRRGSLRDVEQIFGACGLLPPATVVGVVELMSVFWLRI